MITSLYRGYLSYKLKASLAGRQQILDNRVTLQYPDLYMATSFLQSQQRAYLLAHE